MHSNLTSKTLIATLALAAFATAQEPTVTKSREWEKSFGSGYAYGKLEANASMSREDLRVRTLKFSGGRFVAIDRRDNMDYHADLTGKVVLFGRQVTLGQARADLLVEQGIYSRDPNDYKSYARDRNLTTGTLYARAFGVTVLNETRTYTSDILSFSDWTYGFKASKDFWVGPIPVTVAGHMGGGCSASGSLILDASYSNPRLGLSGYLNGYADAWARCGVGISGASAGVKATIKVLNTHVGIDATAGRSDVSGQLNISIVPLQVKIYLYAELLWEEYTKRLAGWSFGARDYLYQLF